MEYKLMMSWDIKPGLDQQYFEFVVREWVPGITRLGMQPREAWYTVYGDCPQISTSIVTDDLRRLRDVLSGEDWAKLHSRLLEFVHNYRQKIVRASAGFQI
ncbi:MAG: hypothetical protein HPY64_09400 [Anaerolineae bacterium]|nr:hypothetical protein [Anaerolineae bacterium]